jgi:hypothetical protein
MYYANSKVKLEKFELQDIRPPKQLTKWVHNKYSF